jgi:hypothetical protein
MVSIVKKTAWLAILLIQDNRSYQFGTGNSLP